MLLLESIPEDIWITIFEHIIEPADLAQIPLVCSKFRLLATKILLKHLLWTKEDPTRRNIEDWVNVHQDLTCLPRRIQLGIPFTGMLYSASRHNLETPLVNNLFNSVIRRMFHFTMLEEIFLSRTIVSPITYELISSFPKLRLLDINTCTFVSYDPIGTSPLPEVDERSTVTTLVLQNNTPSRDQPSTSDIPDHPLHRIAGHSLHSLTITWSSVSSILFATQHWNLPNLKELNLNIALLTRDLMDSAVEFVITNCTASPKVSLRVNKHNIPDNQIASTTIPLPGLNSYWGPLPVVGMFVGRYTELEHVTVTESLEITHLLTGLERLSDKIKSLDLQLRKYDNEVLFAVRQLFPRIESLAVRFGRGLLPENIMVTLGSDILPDLKQLRVLKLSMDGNCMPALPPIDYNAYFLMHFHNQNNPNTNVNIQPPHQQQQFILPNPIHPQYLNLNQNQQHQLQLQQQLEEENALLCDDKYTAFDPDDLKDYLVGWNRYCPMLRTVQLTSVSIWNRRFEGDAWVETVCDPPVVDRSNNSRQGYRRVSDTFFV